MPKNKQNAIINLGRTAASPSRGLALATEQELSDLKDVEKRAFKRTVFTCATRTLHWTSCRTA
jgi:hypothetical protein